MRGRRSLRGQVVSGARPPLCAQSLPYLDHDHVLLTQPTGAPFLRPYSWLVLLPQSTGTLTLKAQ